MFLFGAETVASSRRDASHAFIEPEVGLEHPD